MSIKLSIIIATYNAAKILHTALNSVKVQSFQEWECIVIDGASSDETVNIIKEFTNIDSRFRYISEPDKGIYDAFNKGWKLAKGEWIYYLGADDILSKNALKRVFEIANDDVDIIYGNVIYKHKQKLFSKKPLLNTSLLRKQMICSHQAIIMRKSTINELKGFNIKYKISADYDLTLRCLLKNKKFKYIDIDIAIFDCNGVSNGFKPIIDAYKIRKENHSIGFFQNNIEAIKSFTKRFLRKIKHSIL